MNKFSRLVLITITCCGLLSGWAGAATSVKPKPVPSWNSSFSVADLGRGTDVLLTGLQNQHFIDFGLRKDRLVDTANLALHFTPSPALLPGWSHLLVYLNDVLLGTVPITAQDLGRLTKVNIPLDTFLLSDFNRIKIEFIGNYTEGCSDPAHKTIWANLAGSSQVELAMQAVDLQKDLAFFPLPFFDPNDRAATQLHWVFAAAPNAAEQQAAGIVASLMGSLAGWRGTNFTVHYNQLPPVSAQQVTNAIVFATNTRRPDFLSDTEVYPDVNAPTLTLLDHPEQAFSKLLLVMGRDAKDLQQAAQALALQSPLLRGVSVEVQELQQLEPRQPYDAPNWVPTNRPVRFAELVDYPGQLQVKGRQPEPISLGINLPPDLFIWRNQGIPLTTSYRYTQPFRQDESRLNVSLNGEFISSVPLKHSSEFSLQKVRLGLVSAETANSRERLLMPSLKLGALNTLTYDFNFASSLASTQKEACINPLEVEVQAVIDAESTLDLSGYHHFMALPDLRAFATSGYPFSRLADLSATQVVTQSQPAVAQLNTFLQVLATLGRQTGYPAVAVEVIDTWQEVNPEADLLVIGSVDPQVLASSPGLVLQQSQAWLQQGELEPPEKNQRYKQDVYPAQWQATITASSPLAAIVGMQSPWQKQRSLVALLAFSEADFNLLTNTLQKADQLAQVSGSVALVRSSGVTSQLVGQQYYVGYLPWYSKLWYVMSDHPFVLLLASLVAVLLACLVLWQVLRWQAARRLEER